jgi:adenosylmethionine-8-amino-7-oxononanoate aminotransferase
VRPESATKDRRHDRPKPRLADPAGAPHVWRPYCQMKTARPPLPVVATRGSRLILDDGRELVDGLASWWTACHGYNHPHIAAAVRTSWSACRT